MTIMMAWILENGIKLDQSKAITEQLDRHFVNIVQTTETLTLDITVTDRIQFTRRHIDKHPILNRVKIMEAKSNNYNSTGTNLVLNNSTRMIS